MDLVNWKADFDETEKPLERPAVDGGYVGIFRKIGCVGDSLASGEFEGTKEDGTKSYHDFYDFSWGQYMARRAGCTALNFSRGGMTAAEYCTSFADQHGCFSIENACNAYIVALGVNDISRAVAKAMPLGTPEDAKTLPIGMHTEETFISYYIELLYRLRKQSPDASLFLVTLPKQPKDPARDPFREAHHEMLAALAERLPNVYLIDLYRYAPEYDDDFRKKFFLGGHMNAAGYLFTANLFLSYMDYIIRHNLRKFSQVGFMFTGIRNTVDVD